MFEDWGSANVRRFTRVKVIGVLAAVALGIGTLLPWLIATDVSAGLTVSRPGIDAGSEGLLVLVLAITAGIALFVATRTAAFVAAGAAAVALLFTIRDLSPSPELLTYLGLPGVASLGPGPYVSIVGAIVVLVVAIYGTYALKDT